MNMTKFKTFLHQLNQLKISLRNILHLEIRTKEELILKLKQCLELTIINPETYAIIENTLHLADLQVRDIMMPKGQMVFIPENADYKQIIGLVSQTGHSRFPVVAEHSDEILGILHAKDLLRLSDEEKHDLELTNLIRTANFVPESKRLDALLADFKQNRNHMALVVNEYGQTIGFVTLEDTIEQILGDITDEFDVDEEDPIKFLSEKHFILQGDTKLEIFNQRLQSKLDDSQFDTIAGVLTAQFGYPPKRGEKINFQHFKFKILSSNSRRIKLIECWDKRPNEDQLQSNESDHHE
jgi:magnesium and cobalt transporter